jgi:hypothetical protein
MGVLSYSEQETFYWHKRIEEFISSGSDNKVTFCKDNNLDPKKFSNLYYRIYHPLLQDKSYRDKMLRLAKEWPNSGLSQHAFAKKNNVHHNKLSQYVSHVRSWEIIERLEKENATPEDATPMNFIQVPNKSLAVAKKQEEFSEAEQEVIEKQNDIEIIISKGVKVSISPNIESMKIIKIIELLKDL